MTATRKKMPAKGKKQSAAKPAGAKKAVGRSATRSASRNASKLQAERMLRKRTEVTSYDTYGYNAEFEEDYFVVPERGRTYGRCGGRPIQSLMEQRLCDKLSRQGVAHSHAPRRYEVKVESGRVAAYSPCIVLRGRGREGKTAIIEVVADWDEIQVQKIRAFRALYESEFYVIFVAPGPVFDKVPVSTYDEGVLPSEVGSLVARLAE